MVAFHREAAEYNSYLKRQIRVELIEISSNENYKIDREVDINLPKNGFYMQNNANDKYDLALYFFYFAVSPSNCLFYDENC